MENVFIVYELANARQTMIFPHICVGNAASCYAWTE